MIKKTMKKNDTKKLLIVMLAIFAVFLFYWIYKNSYNTERPSQVALKTIQDPDNYYSVSVPQNWSMRQTAAYGKTGIGTKDEKSQKIEILNYYSPEEKVGVVIQAYEGYPVCNPTEKDNTTLANMPAYYNNTKRMWVMDTTNGTLVINYYYPGISSFYHGPRGEITPTALSQNLQDEYELLFNKVIRSFRPKNLQAAGC